MSLLARMFTRIIVWSIPVGLAVTTMSVGSAVYAASSYSHVGHNPHVELYESPFNVFGMNSLAAPDPAFAPFHVEETNEDHKSFHETDGEEGVVQVSGLMFGETEEPSCVPESCCPTDCHEETWLDRLQLFAGIDGAKQPQDLGINANLGGRIHANLGIPLVEDWGLGLQIGTAFVAAGNAVAVLETVDGTEGRTQFFTTAGIFQRLDNGLNWGVAHDFLYQEYFDSNFLTQWRFQAGYELSDRNEIGVWSTLRAMGDDAVIGGTSVRLQAINQINVYWNHVWPTAAETAVWVGVCESHGQEVLVFPQDDRTSAMPILGARVMCPLSDHWSLYGETNLMMPADSGTVDAFLGFAFYPGGNALRQRQTRFRPLLPMGGSPTFSVDLDRR
jgi:hypothetical protein